MELYLMQHGTCFSKDIDPDQPLSPVGSEQIAKSAEAVRRLGLSFDCIVASPKTRSIQTAQAVAEAVGYPVESIVVTDQVKAMTPPAKTAAMLAEYAPPEDEQYAMLICGHLPNLAELASLLMTDQGKARIAFSNGGLTRLDLPPEPGRRATLRFCLTPLHLQIIAGG